MSQHAYAVFCKWLETLGYQTKGKGMFITQKACDYLLSSYNYYTNIAPVCKLQAQCVLNLMTHTHYTEIFWQWINFQYWKYQAQYLSNVEGVKCEEVVTWVRWRGVPLPLWLVRGLPFLNIPGNGFHCLPCRNASVPWLAGEIHTHLQCACVQKCVGGLKCVARNEVFTTVIHSP